VSLESLSSLPNLSLFLSLSFSLHLSLFFSLFLSLSLSLSFSAAPDLPISPRFAYMNVKFTDFGGLEEGGGESRREQEKEDNRINTVDTTHLDRHPSYSIHLQYYSI
jgi:hypothetical protein